MRALGGKVVAPSRAMTASAVLFPTILDVTALAPTLKACSRQGLRVLVDSDADVFAGDGHLVVADAKNPATGGLAPAHSVKRWRSQYQAMVRQADAITVATPYLAKVYERMGARQVFLCPNAIDPAQWPAPARRDTSIFTVGFAGGPGNKKDLELIRPALEWASGQTDVEAVVFGGFFDLAQSGLPVGFQFRFDLDASPFPPEWRRFKWRHIPFTPSYAKYRATLNGLFDVGLMPLADTPFNRGRSDLKICEYALAGALPIVSDAPNYAEWKDTAVLFARDAGEFVEHIKWATEHREEARERADAVRQVVLERRTIEKTIPLWREAFAASGPALEAKGGTT